MLQPPGPSQWAPPTPTRSPSPYQQAAPQKLPGLVEPPNVRKILSLDGGGIRGLSIIIILKYIMKSLNRKRGNKLEPWQEFDMIGGTSTGGLIAIMLGRLRMSLDECEEAYKALSEQIFTPIRDAVDPRRVYDFLKANGKFDEKPLERCIKDTIRSRRLDPDDLLRDFDEDTSCKV